MQPQTYERCDLLAATWCVLHGRQRPAQMDAYDRYSASGVSDNEPEPFITAAAFAGNKPGYVFKMDSEGVGYYLDGREIKKKTKNLMIPAAPRLGGTNGQQGVSIERRLAQSDVLKEDLSQKLETIHKPIAVPTSDPGLVPFVKSDSWRGGKAGYVFTMRDGQLGYWLDDKDAAAAAKEATSTAMVLSTHASHEDSKVKSFQMQLALFGQTEKPKEIVYPFDAGEAAAAVERLSQPGHKFMNLNPLHVLDVHVQHTMEDLQMAFAKYTSLLNPKENTDARAIPLLETVEKAFEILINPDKRDRVLETCVQAKDRVEYDVKQKNKERSKKGELLIPATGPEFDQLVDKMRYKLLAELDERFKRVELTALRNKEELKLKREKLQEKKAKDETWEAEREDRVGGWRMFSKRAKKRARLGAGTKLWVKTEERQEHQIEKQVEDEYTTNNKYKRTWR
eukprot:SAG31_NODE_88_length_26714_cov_6.972046_1_plen_452_part_00